MPHIGWAYKGQEYTFDDVRQLAKQDGTFANFPLTVLNRMADTDRSPTVLSPSSASRCPRQRILKSTEDYYLDPESVWGRAIGSAIHEWIEDDTENTELTLGLTLSDGVRLAGTIDSYDPETKSITDYKTIHRFIIWNDETKQREQRTLPDEHHVTQLQLYTLLLRHHGYEVERGYIWYVRQDREATRKMCEVELWEDDLIRSVAEWLSHPIAIWKKDGTLPAPYVEGDEGYKQCRYCEVAAACARIALEEDEAA